MTPVYAVVAVIALIFLLGYAIFVRKKDIWLFGMFICVAIVNVGYFLLSIANSLTFAIIANDISYLGSVFLPLCMLGTITGLCGFAVNKRFVITAAAIGLLMFSIVATAGILPWYYQEVSLVYVDGTAKLQKVYGVLHPLYLLYLISYFTAMIVCIVRSARMQVKASQRHAVLVAAIVFGNIGVWFIEKFISWDFEFLSVSYLFSEIIFLALHWMMQDYVRSDLIPQPDPAPPVAVPEASSPVVVDIATMPIEEKILKVLSYLDEGEVLAMREREILEMILLNKKRRMIAEELHLSENTIKTYTRTLYSKLGVNSREELYALLVK